MFVNTRSGSVKLIVRSIVVMMLLFIIGTCVSAEGSPELTFRDFPVSSSIPGGSSEKYTVNVGEKGTLNFNVDIDSSEGYLYLYDKRGMPIVNKHFTKEDMPVKISTEVKKGKYTLEVSRSGAGSGSGEVTVDANFYYDLEAFLFKAGVGFFLVFAVSIGGRMICPRYGRNGRGRLYRENGRLRFGQRGMLDSIEAIMGVIELFRK